ncbi:hypothetical protein C8J56DRAFT_1037649 [Mycena floridula]|nr:hypothetical protein C8J56DRAFT_1037649 [Mycena floridula]
MTVGRDVDTAGYSMFHDNGRGIKSSLIYLKSKIFLFLLSCLNPLLHLLIHLLFAMTEYDYSPEAMERFMANQQRIAKWVDNTEAHSHEFIAPDVPSPTSGHPGHTKGHSAHRPPTPHHKRAPKPIILPALPFADPLVAPLYMFQSLPPSPLGAGYPAGYSAQTQAYRAGYSAGYPEQQAGYTS